MAFLETMAKLIERYSSFFTEGIVNTLIIAAFCRSVRRDTGHADGLRCGCAASLPCGGWRWRTSSLSAERR